MIASPIATEARTICAGIGSPEYQSKRLALYSRHLSIAQDLARGFKNIHDKYGYDNAKAWLSSIEKRLKLAESGLFLDSSDSEIRDKADMLSRIAANRVMSAARHYGRENLNAIIVDISEFCSSNGVTFPIQPCDFKVERLITMLSKIQEPSWWRRQLKTECYRGFEHLNRTLGLVSKQRGAYVSEWSLNRQINRKARNVECLLSMEAVNELGYSASIFELSKTGTANPENRVNEQIVKSKGHEQIALDLGLSCAFITLTCPSAYHARHADGRPNVKYNGTTPRDAQEYLVSQWAKIRATWAKQDIKAFGTRVAEPHHDGTPHWHMVLYFVPSQFYAAKQVFKRFALQHDPLEKGAQKYRYDWKTLDLTDEKQSVTGYLLKYLLKNVNAPEITTDFEDYETGETVTVSGSRVEAWASIWGIRQFQTQGSASVTVWRELRRLANAKNEQIDLTILEILQAADQGDWAEFVRLMGGPTVKRSHALLRPLFSSDQHFGPQSPELNETEHGEAYRRIVGIIMRQGSAYLTRLHVWTIQKKASEAVKKSSFDLDLRGAVAPPRSCVNNCNRPPKGLH